MKKILVLLLIGLLFVVGCTGVEKNSEKKPDSENPKQAENSNQDGKQPRETNESKESYPEKVTQWLDTYRPIFAADLMIIDDKTYIMVSWGEQSTGGYSVEVTDIKETSDRLIVTVNFDAPGPEALVTQALTYPQTVKVLEGVVEKKVEFVAEGDENYVPQVVGMETSISQFKKINPALATADIKKSNGQVSLSGIARVFEAVVDYRFLDAEGSTLAEGYVNSAIAAPDWGTFEIEKDVPEGAVTLQIFTASAKDGTPQNILEYNLK